MGGERTRPRSPPPSLLLGGISTLLGESHIESLHLTLAPAELLGCAGGNEQQEQQDEALIFIGVGRGGGGGALSSKTCREAKQCQTLVA
jgi:hypothetical protein